MDDGIEGHLLVVGRTGFRERRLDPIVRGVCLGMCRSMLLLLGLEMMGRDLGKA